MNSRFVKRSRARGFTLLEMLIVVAVLAVASVVLVPALSPAQPYKLDLAASQFAEAVRYAQAEALRTGSHYGVRIYDAGERIRVYRDTSGTQPPTPIFDVYHPVTKRLYDIDLDLNPLTEGVALATSFVHLGTCSSPRFLGFDAAGTPRCGNPWAIGAKAIALILTYEGHTRTIAIAGETGRVTIQ